MLIQGLDPELVYDLQINNLGLFQWVTSAHLARVIRLKLLHCSVKRRRSPHYLSGDNEHGMCAYLALWKLSAAPGDVQDADKCWKHL